MNEIHVATWNELNDWLFRDAWNPELHRFRSPLVFRGVENADYDLSTSLMRQGGTYAELETHILQDFRKYAHREAAAGDSVWNWLALAQHHGLPTRLLDWTYSPYVALHFLTQDTDHFGMDGAVWCVDRRLAHQALPMPLRDLLADEDSNTFTAEMLHGAAPSLAALDRLSPDVFALFLEPPSLDERIVNQFALFSLLSSPTARLDHWLAQRPNIARRLIVPASLKWEVRDKLDQANITERVLYPGLDGLSRWLKRYYTPRDIAPTINTPSSPERHRRNRDTGRSDAPFSITLS